MQIFAKFASGNWVFSHFFALSCVKWLTNLSIGTVHDRGPIFAVRFLCQSSWVNNTPDFELLHLQNPLVWRFCKCAKNSQRHKNNQRPYMITKRDYGFSLFFFFLSLKTLENYFMKIVFLKFCIFLCFHRSHLAKRTF